MTDWSKVRTSADEYREVIEKIPKSFPTAAAGEEDIPFPDSQPQPEEKKKKRTTFSSTAETLAWARGIWGPGRVCNASHWQAWKTKPGQAQRGPGGVRKDMWGFQDVQVLDGHPGVLALQACGTDVGTHQRKMEREQGDAVRAWLQAGNRLLIVAWRPIWVQKSKTHKVKKMTPRFIEGVLTPHPPGFTLGASDRELEWVEHDQWPPRAEKGSVRHYLKEHGLEKTGYDCDGVHLWLEPGEAKVKVKVEGGGDGLEE